MKTSVLTILFSLLSILLFAQRAEKDIILAGDNQLTIQPILHGSLVLEWNGQTIYIDPYGGRERFKGLNDPDIILITDIHGDHLNQTTLDELNTGGSVFIVPEAVKRKLPESMQAKATSISNGQTIVVSNIEILAIPMYNLPEDEDSRHPKGRGNGYVLGIGDKRIYISGDTEDIPEMRNLRNIDIAFVCMNLPFTMDIDQAASAVNDFRPSIVYPYHYRGKDGLSDIESFKVKVTANNPEIEVRLRNWYPD